MRTGSHSGLTSQWSCSVSFSRLRPTVSTNASRTDRWSFSLATEAGQQILNGALLCVGIDLLRTVPSTLSYVPPGQLYLVGANDPTLATINTVNLIYVTSE